MPFTKAEFIDTDEVEHTLDESELKHIYEGLFVKAVKSYNNNSVSFINVHRSNAKRGNFVKDIVGKLQDYDLVIADLTGSNSNVFYELGIRHTLTNGTIMINQDVKHLPSDLGNYIGAEYKYHKKAVEFDAYYPEFQKKIHSLIDDALEETDRVDNPVRDFIGDRIIFRDEERIKEIEKNIELIESVKISYGIFMKASLFNISYALKGKRDTPVQQPLTVIFNAFYNRLVMLQKNTPAIEFIANLIFSTELIQDNLRNAVRGGWARDKEKLRTLWLNLYDMENKMHHVLDIEHLYRYDSGKNTYICINEQNEPMLKSFDFFIDEWKKELEELTK